MLTPVQRTLQFLLQLSAEGTTSISTVILGALAASFATALVTYLFGKTSAAANRAALEASLRSLDAEYTQKTAEAKNVQAKFIPGWLGAWPGWWR